MKKMKRKKIILEVLEEKLAKYGRRMQAISEEAYKLRLAIEELQKQPKNVPLTKASREALEKEKENALLNTGTKEQLGVGTPDANAGGSDIQNSTTPETVLGQ